MVGDQLVTFVIPSWNGKHLLEQLLPSVIEAIRHSGCDNHEVLVVDDASTDDSVAFLTSAFPSVQVIEIGSNKGFAKACNVGVEAARNEIVVLLNNDVLVEPDFLGPLLAHFEDQDVFAVGSRVYYRDKKTIYVGKTAGRFRCGVFFTVPPSQLNHEKPSYSLWAGGGTSAFSRSKFLLLGGFDSLFFPFYFEDTDLCFRAWKRGWKVIYEPRSVMFHEPSSTIARVHSQREIKLLENRNRFLFTWKNFTQARYLILQPIGVPLVAIGAAIAGKPYVLLGLFQALRQLPTVLERRETMPASVLTEAQILDLCLNTC